MNRQLTRLNPGAAATTAVGLRLPEPLLSPAPNACGVGIALDRVEDPVLTPASGVFGVQSWPAAGCRVTTTSSVWKPPLAPPASCGRRSAGGTDPDQRSLQELS